MNPFDFVSVNKIVFGRGKFQRIGELTADFGRSALVVTNADRSGQQKLMERLGGLLSASGVSHKLFWIDREPTVEDVDRGVESAKSTGADVVIGIGGGSAMDAAKAIAALAVNGGSALDYMEVIGKGQKITRAGLPVITVPTTAGTGAEVTRNAVIGCPEKQYKASIRADVMLPKVALVDAELHVHVRPEVTARTGMDALTQLIEAYTSKNANEMTDALALRGIQSMAWGLHAFNKPTDLDIREAAAFGALLSGITLTNAGLGAVHGFAAPIGARYPIPHGTVCGLLLPHVTELNYAVMLEDREDGIKRLMEKYVKIATALFPVKGMQTEEWQELSESVKGRGVRIVRPLETLVKTFNIPSLRTFGIQREHFPEIVALAKKANSMKTNPVELTDAELTEILEKAY